MLDGGARDIETPQSETSPSVDATNVSCARHIADSDAIWTRRRQCRERLLPKTLPRLHGVRFAWAFEPCETLAGDSFNVFTVDEDHVALYLLDFSGHGVAAALQAVALTRVLASRPWPISALLRILSPAEVTDDLNREFPIDPET